MTLPAGSLSPAIQSLLAALPELFTGEQPIPLKNIRPNPDNPGAAITEDQIKELAENIQTRGLLNAIRVNPDWANPLVGNAQPHPDNFRLKADGQPWQVGDFNFVVLTGENRYRAALWLKWETIRGAILNPTAKEAVVINHLDNDVRERGWWAAYQSIENLVKADPHLTQRQIGAELKMDKDKVGRALRLLPLLNPDSRAYLVGDSDKQNKGIWPISEMAAAKLAGLGPTATLKRSGSPHDPPQALYPYPPIPPETQDLVYRALVVAVDQQLTETQVSKLVEQVKAGVVPEDFNLKAIHSSPVKGPGQPVQPAPEKALTQPHSIGSEHDTAQATVSSPALTEASPEKGPTSQAEAFTHPQEAKKGVQWLSTQKMEHLLKKAAEWLALSSWRSLVKYEHHLFKSIAAYIVPVKDFSLRQGFGRQVGSSTNHHRQGTSFSPATMVALILHWFVYTLLQLTFWWLILTGLASHFAPVLTPWVKWPFHLLAHELFGVVPNLIWPGVIHDGVTAVVVLLVVIGIFKAAKDQSARMAVLGLVIGLLWNFGRGSWTMPTDPTIAAKLESSPGVTLPAMTPVSTPQLAASTPSKSHPTPKSTKAVPLPTIIVDQNILETEAAALPPNCKVKRFVFMTNGSMGLDMAAHRLADVTDTEKFTARLGKDAKKILSVQPTSTSLILTYTDPGVGSLLGNSKLEFYWEDVKYMQTADLELSPTNHWYQVSIVVNDLKQPITFQSSKPENIQHFVSAMQAWLRAERHDNGVDVANIPYVNLGVRWDNDGLVTALWDQSPMDKAGLKIGDHLWGLKEYAPQMSQSDLEAALHSMPPGQHSLFIVTPSLWKQALAEKGADPSGALNPVKVKKILVVQPTQGAEK
jgi:hypothetical protein